MVLLSSKPQALSHDVHGTLEVLQGGTYLGVVRRRDKEDEIYLPIPSCLLFSTGQVHGGSSQDTSVAFYTTPHSPERRAVPRIGDGSEGKGRKTGLHGEVE